jgi:hypothetical protein
MQQLRASQRSRLDSRNERVVPADRSFPVCKRLKSCGTLMEKSVAPLDFGLLIAYLLPGFVTFNAITFVSPRAQAFLDAAVARDAALGGSFLVLLSSLTLGVIVSAVRSVLLDPIAWKTGVRRGDLSYAALRDAGVREAFHQAVTNVYRFAQFYGNMFIGVLLLVTIKILISPIFIVLKPILTGMLVISLFLLHLAYRRQLDQTFVVTSELVGLKDIPEVPSGSESETGKEG